MEHQLSLLAIVVTNALQRQMTIGDRISFFSTRNGFKLWQKNDLPPTYIRRQSLHKRALSAAIYTVVLSVACSALGQSKLYKL